MDYTGLYILLLSFFGLLILGVPISWSLGWAATFTLLYTAPFLPSVTTIAQRMAVGLDSFSLLAIPFFILAGEIMNRGGIAKRLIEFAKALLGPLPGSLLYVNIVGAVLFGAIAGSAVAAASAIGGILAPRMEKENYPRELGASVNITASTTGLIIPPSNILIIYSLASGGVSIAALFVAGYLPGLLVAVSLMITAAWFVKRKKISAGTHLASGQIFKTFLRALPGLGLLIVVMGGIIGGLFTATEASAIAVLYALALALWYRDLSWKHLRPVFLKAAETSAIVLLLIATSMSLSWVMSSEEIPQSISQALLSLSDNPWVILLLINLTLLTVGIFMDMTPAVLIFTPIFLPVVVDLGIDPVHFGIIMVLNLCIGLCTPPVGSLLFIGVEVAKTKIQWIVKPLIPFFVAMIVALVIVSIWPSLTLFLPRLFGLM